MKKLWVCVAFGLLAGCPSAPLPGDEQMGRFNFQAEPQGGDCPFSEIPDGGFKFEVKLSRFKYENRAFVTIGQVSHEGRFDGQKVTAQYTGERNFAQCNCPADDGGLRAITTMTETFQVTLVSKSQSDAVGGCIENPPVNPDAGIIGPDTSNEGGFDAIRACGTLVEDIRVNPPVSTPTSTCLAQCSQCRLSYTLTGERK